MTGNLALGDLLRLVKYALYFLLFPLAAKSTSILGERGVKFALILFFAVGVAVSAISLWRINQFVAAGNAINFWVYSPNSRSVGFLGQYFDPTTFTVGEIPKAAHATFGLYLSVVLGAGLVFLSLVRLVSFQLVGLLVGVGVIFAALLYTLARGAVITGFLVTLAGMVVLWLRGRFLILALLLLFLFLESAVALQLNPEVYYKFASTFPGAKTAVTAFARVAVPVGEGTLQTWEWLRNSIASFLLPVSRSTSAPTAVSTPPSTPPSPSSQPAASQASPQSVPLTPLAELAQPASYTDLSLDASLADRVTFWQDTIHLLLSRWQFFIFGVGYNTDNLRYFTGGKVIYPHSLFLDMWVRGGLISLALMLAIWILLFAQTAQFCFSRRAFGLVLFGFLIGWFWDNAISGEQFFSDAPMLAFWGTFGFLTALVAGTKPKATGRRVLIALTSSDLGGAPQVVYDLLSHIKQKENSSNGFNFIVALPEGGLFVRKFRDLGYPVYPIALDHISVKTLKKFFDIVQGENIDLIATHGKGAGLYGRLASIVLGIPVVHTFHGIHYVRYGRLGRFFYLNLERFLSVFTRLIVNVSPSQQKEGVALKIFPPEKGRIVENGVDIHNIKNQKSKIKVLKIKNKLGIGEKDFMVVVLARFDPIKGHARLISMLPAILKEVPRLKLVLVGSGKEEIKIKALVRELRVSDAVIFAGRQENPRQILGTADVLLQPSYQEGLPLAPLEAASCEVPVIAAKTVGNVDVVLDGRTGYLVDFNNKAEVIRAIRQLGNKAIRQKMGEQGKAWVAEKFPMRKFVRKTLGVYEEALGRI